LGSSVVEGGEGDAPEFLLAAAVQTLDLGRSQSEVVEVGPVTVQTH
jgi:hypothetical protein